MGMNKIKVTQNMNTYKKRHKFGGGVEIILKGFVEILQSKISLSFLSL